MAKYTLEEFEKIKRYGAGESINREGIMAHEIIKFLKDNAGKASRQEFIQYLIDTDEVIPKEYVTKIYTGKNDKEFSYFTFDYQFARKNLIIAGYLKSEQRGIIELTTKGYEIELNHFDYLKDVISKNQSYWSEHKGKHKKKDVNSEGNDELEEIEISNVLNADQWRDDLKAALIKMTPKKFEAFSRLLVKNMGVNIDPTKGVQVSNDGGIDGFGYMVADDFRTNRVGIQAKRWQNNIGRVEIQSFIGALSTNLNQAEYGIFITTSYFNKNAIETARSSTIPITLINSDDICDLVAKYEIFVKPVTIYELEDFYFNK